MSWLAPVIIVNTSEKGIEINNYLIFLEAQCLTPQMPKIPFIQAIVVIKIPCMVSFKGKVVCLHAPPLEFWILNVCDVILTYPSILLIFVLSSHDKYSCYKQFYNIRGRIFSQSSHWNQKIGYSTCFDA